MNRSPKWIEGKIKETLVLALMEAVDFAGERRSLFWAAQSVELSPFTLLGVLIRIGAFKVAESRVTIWDYQRQDYVPYTSRADVSWWAETWNYIMDWLERAAAEE